MANGLGRGLSSLIPQRNQNIQNPQNSQNIQVGNVQNIVNEEKSDISAASLSVDPAGSERMARISPDKIKVNPMQPRKIFSDFSMDELVKSVKEYGIIQPLIVTQSSDNSYELISGERRLRAAKTVGLKEILCIVRDASEQKKLGMALVENLQRENLNPMETSSAYYRLVDEFGLSQEEVADKMGKSRSAVSNSLRLLSLPKEIQEALQDGRLTEGHAKYLLGIEGAEKQSMLFRNIIHKNLSVKNTVKEARRMGGTKQARIKINYRDKDKEFALREFFNTKIEIKRTGKGGQIIIDFFSDEELDQIVSKVK